ncbi:phospholipase D regulator [Aspergillus lucknowensis]|uniref:Regulator of phospholipase D SRF1 n=1 Tax=Aspergillus lucknowensis TaxID=176173 RepID=A0ABR4LMH6_9EURO
MAQDVRETRVQPPDSGLLANDQLMEKSPTGEWTSPHISNSPGGQNSNNPPLDLFRNGITDQPRAPQGIANEVEETTGPSQEFESNPRTLPAWIRSLEYPDDDIEATATSRLIPTQPGDAFVAQHNHSPYSTSKPGLGSSNCWRGSEEEITTIRESRWKSFSKTIAYPREHGVEEKLVTPEWLNENHGDYSQPWRGQLEPDEDTEDPLKKKRRREIWFKRFHNTLLQSPIVPLIIRLTVWSFSLTALALGGSIQRLSENFAHPQGPSALMAIIVDAVALVYLIYITWDEYTSKPLGLRSPSAKARLILLDLFFIVFDSANLSLAFESLSSAEGACTVAQINQTLAPKNDDICDRQIALASVLLIALIAWLITFSISVLR